MCSAFERKEVWFLSIKNIMCEHETAIKNDQIHHWSLKNQDLYDLFLETLFWINSCPTHKLIKLQIFDSLALNMSFLQDCFGGYVSISRKGYMQKYQHVWKKENEIWNMTWWKYTFNINLFQTKYFKCRHELKCLELLQAYFQHRQKKIEN